MKPFLFTLLFAVLVPVGASNSFAAEDGAKTGGTIKGSLFADKNGNGKYDEGEDVDVKITLLMLQDGKWVAVEASYSIENGEFVFENVPPGATYRLQFEYGNGAVRTTQSFELTSEGGAPPTISMSIPLSQNAQGNLVIPNTYSQGGESSSYVNLSAIVGEEVSTFKP